MNMYWRIRMMYYLPASVITGIGFAELHSYLTLPWWQSTWKAYVMGLVLALTTKNMDET